MDLASVRNVACAAPRGRPGKGELMNLHKNEVHLAGVLARDPELRYTTSGKLVANFTVATTYEKHTEYHRCTAWEDKAEKLAENFHKGDYIKLCGRLQT